MRGNETIVFDFCFFIGNIFYMWRNKKNLLMFIFIALLLGALMYGGYIKYQKGTQSINDLEEWVTYDVSDYNFSFDYPRDGIVDAQQDTSGRFLRIQNYDTQDVSHSISGKHWIEFFAFTKDNNAIPCPRNIVNYNIIDLDGVTMYKGVTQPDEGSGAGGGHDAVCIERQNYNLYIQGQDGTTENIFEQIVNSIQFME